MVGAFGEVYVMDWGVDAVAGTPAFRAPEGPRDERSDIYSLGALLKLSLERPKPVPQLLAIAARAMNPDAAKRYPNAAAFLSEIERYQSGLAVEAYPESPWETALRYARQNAVLLWLLAAFAAVKFFLFFLRAR
jgi:serine/threonine protein kinase